jgi:predicted aminopeptidase
MSIARADAPGRRATHRVGAWSTLAMLLFVSSLVSCSPGYVLRAAWEETRILARRRPIAEALNDASLGEATRGKLEIVIQARTFAQRDLALDVGDSYTSFSDIGRDTLALVLSASPMDRLAAHTWWFPIVGRVPYKGFFSLEAAEKERRKLEEKHYDTYLRTTSAFSTLGWLPDPLLSTVLRQDSVGLVETVIHEVTHNTLFVTGQVKFNESFANFVGSVGAIEFFCRPGQDAVLCQVARDRWHDSIRFGEFLDYLWCELEALYSEGLDRVTLAPKREALLTEAAAHFARDYAPAMRTRGFARYDVTQINNASLIARHLYYHRLNLFDALYERTNDLRRTFQLIAEAVRESEDPWAGLERLVAEEVGAG